MALEVEVLNGGGTAAGTAVLTSLLRADAGLTLGNRAYDGQGGQGTLVFDDDDGEYGNEEDLPVGLTMLSVAAHNVITVVETATTSPTYLLNGRVGQKAIGRGDKHQDRSRQVRLTLEDSNSHLRGITLTSDQARSSESDVTRATWALETYLQGSPRPTTDLASRIIDSDTVTMPAKTYEAGTPIIDILRDCATAAGKVFFVYNEGDGTLSLYYAVNSDTTLQAGLRISDDEDEISTSPEALTVADTASGTNSSDVLNLTPLIVGTEAGRAIYAIVMSAEVLSIKWRPGFVNSGTPGVDGGDLELVDSVEVDGGINLAVYRILDPTPSTTATSAVAIERSSGVRCIAGAWSVYGASANVTTSKNTGEGSSSSLSATAGDRIIEAAAWADVNSTIDAPVEAGDNTERFSLTIDRTTGFYDYGMGGADGTDNTPAWNFTNSHTWAAIAVTINGGGATYAPIWVNNTAAVENGLSLLSGGVLRHGGGAATSNDTDIVDAYDYWVEPINDVQAVDGTDATNRLAKILALRNTEDRTYTVAVQLHRSEVDLVHAGDLIDIKARAIPDADDQYRTRRIASLEWQWVGPEHWLAVMELDRPLVGVGNPGSSGTSKAEVTAAQKADAAVTAHESASDPHSGYVKESEFTAAGDLLVGTGSATLTRRKNNMTATAAPTTGDDSGDGYAVGSLWYDTTNDKAYTALDVTVAAAVWKEITASPTGGTVTVEEEDGSPTGSFSTIKFPNGSVTDNGDGSVSVATSSGSGGPVEQVKIVRANGGTVVSPENAAETQVPDLATISVTLSATRTLRVQYQAQIVKGTNGHPVKFHAYRDSTKLPEPDNGWYSQAVNEGSRHQVSALWVEESLASGTYVISIKSNAALGTSSTTYQEQVLEVQVINES